MEFRRRGRQRLRLSLEAAPATRHNARLEAESPVRPLFRHLAFLILLSVAAPVRAQIAMPGGVALSPRAVAQNPANYAVFGDGDGGVWAVFQTAEPGAPLYVNHVDADGGYAQGFSSKPRPLTQRSTSVNSLSAAPDGVGGAIITWFSVSPKDSTSPFIALRYHHIDSGGLLMTPDTGLVVSSVASAAMCVGDGLGGGYVIWEELKGTSNPDIVGQHFDYFGVPQWSLFNSTTGFNMCSIIGLQRVRGLVEDGAGGAYALWSDSRMSSTAPLYAAHLLATGVAGAPWPANGLRVSPSTSGIRVTGFARSTSNGLWLAWRDINIPNQLTGQHVLGNGSFGWGALGQVIATVSPSRVEFVPTGPGEALVTWGGGDIRCQRLAANGTRLWPENAGRVIVTPPGGAVNTRVASDSVGGQRILWSTDNAGQTDAAMLRVDGLALPLVGEPIGGTVVESDTVAEDALLIVNSPSASPTIVWLEAGVLRARRIQSGTLGAPPLDRAAAIALAAPYPNPIRGSHFAFRFHAPAGSATLELFDVTGRVVLSQSITTTGGEQNMSVAPANALSPGVYTARLRVGTRSVSRRIVRVN